MLCVLSRFSRATLCDPTDCTQLGSSVSVILQARTLELLPCPSPGDLPNPGIEPVSLTFPVLKGGFFTTSTTWEAPRIHIYFAKITSSLTCNSYHLHTPCYQKSGGSWGSENQRSYVRRSESHSKSATKSELEQVFPNLEFSKGYATSAKESLCSR